MTPLAISSSGRTALAIGIIVGLIALLGLIVLLTQLAERAGMIGRRRAKVPPGLRPGPSDEALERRILERYLGWGAVITIFFAIFLPVYWLREPTRIADKKEQFDAESIARGHEIYGPNGVNCAQCHGMEGEGGVRQFLLPGTNRTVPYAEPPLAFLVARYKAAGRNDDEIKQLVRDAIERGRPGTPMPTWGLSFGGPLNSQQLDDIINYVLSTRFQKKPPTTTETNGKSIFLANCAICHNAQATGSIAQDDPRVLARGGVAPNLTVEFQRNSARQIHDTIFGGRLNTNRPSMPSWAFLGERAIQALVSFLRSIQVA